MRKPKILWQEATVSDYSRKRKSKEALTHPLRNAPTGFRRGKASAVAVVASLLEVENAWRRDAREGIASREEAVRN